jgi:hypothetical protein
MLERYATEVMVLRAYAIFLEEVKCDTNGASYYHS